jgi:prepilin-type N-terminal cleavage/methylation domain-containing protein
MARHHGVRGADANGFTLIELLGVVTVLGILSGITLVSLTGFRSTSAQATCAADARSLIGAEDTAMASTGAYLDEADLVSQGFLREPISSYDVSVSGATYSVTPNGDCTTSGTVGPTTTTAAPTTTSSPTTSTTSTTTSTTTTSTTTTSTTTTSTTQPQTRPVVTITSVTAQSGHKVTVVGTATSTGAVNVTVYTNSACTASTDSFSATPTGGAWSGTSGNVGNGNVWVKATQTNAAGTGSSTCFGPTNS